MKRGGERRKEPGGDSRQESVVKTRIWNRESGSGILAQTNA